MSQPPSIRRFGQAVVRRAWLLLAVVALVVAITGAGTSSLPDRYSARVTLRISTAGALSGDVVRSEDSAYLERLQNTYSALASSLPLRVALMRRANLNERPEVSAEGRPASELMDLTVRTGSARSAAAAADELAFLLIDNVRELDSLNFDATEAAAQGAIRTLQAEIAAARTERDSLGAAPSASEAVKALTKNLDSQIDLKTAALSQQQTNYGRLRSVHLERSSVLTVVTPAVVPTSASSPPGLAKVLVAALIIGLIGGLSLIAIFERARSRVVYPDEVERAAAGPRVIARLATSRRVGILSADARAADGFRGVRTELLLTADRTTLRSILVTSPQGTTGAAWVAANLAVAFGRAGHPCTVVDGDVRSPSLHTAFGLDGQLGIADVLREAAPLDAVAVATAEPGLSLIPAGALALETSDALTPVRVAKIVAALEHNSEMTIIHSPLAAVDADVLAYASVVSGVLLVVRSAQTFRSDITEACERLNGAGACILGVVLLERKAGS